MAGDELRAELREVARLLREYAADAASTRATLAGMGSRLDDHGRATAARLDDLADRLMLLERGQVPRAEAMGLLQGRAGIALAVLAALAGAGLSMALQWAQTPHRPTPAPHEQSLDVDVDDDPAAR